MKDDVLTSLVWASGFGSLFTPLIYAIALAKGAGAGPALQVVAGLLAGFGCFIGWGMLLMQLESRYNYPLVARLKPEWKGGSFLAVVFGFGWVYGIVVLTLAVVR